MKKTNMKRFLLLFCMLACVLSMTACTDTISSADTKIAAKNSKAQSYQLEIGAWAIDMINYLNSATDAQIKQDGEKARSISDVFENDYIINKDGIDTKTIEFYNSWVKTREDLGTLISVDSCVIEVSKETGTLCTVVMEATYSKRTCSFELVIDEKLNLTSGAINPTYTTGEKVVKALLNTVIGMGTVFIVLIFISFIISLLKYVNRIGSKKEEKQDNKASQTTESVDNTVSQEDTSEEDEMDDCELVAAIAAAIAAYEQTSPEGLVVRSIRKVGKSNNWK